MSARLKQVEDLKAKLTPDLNNVALQWHTVDLGFHATVEVCVPVSVTVPMESVVQREFFFPKSTAAVTPPLFVPVTKLETWKLAKHFDAFPLTSKVLLSVYKTQGMKIVPVSTKVKFDASMPETDNFVEYSKYILSCGVNVSQLFSGALKLWILSNAPATKTTPVGEDASVNYGMYWPSAAIRGRIQGPDGAHGKDFWDYSQLLQLMRNFKIYGHKVDLDIALLSGHPGLWDYTEEGVPYRKISKIDTEYLPFVGITASNPKTTASMLKGRWKVQYPASGEETYMFSDNTVTWAGKQGKGSGFWVEKNKQVTISWKNTGSIEHWTLPGGTSCEGTLNFLNKCVAMKIG